MITVKPNDAVVGATIEGLNASLSIGAEDWGLLLRALGRYGVLRLPNQRLEPDQLRAFSERFGGIQGAIQKAAKDGKEEAEVGILSNLKENDRYIGMHDAGQEWHTDTSYRDVMGFVNVLYGVVIPHREGRPLGGTEFSNVHAAYEGLPADIRERLVGMTATHDFNKYWEFIRRERGSTRPALTEEQRRRRPPSVHPVVMRHPITRRPVLYCNPGYASTNCRRPRASRCSASSSSIS